MYGQEFCLDPDGKEISTYTILLTSFAVSFDKNKGVFIGLAALEAQFEEVQNIKSDTNETSKILLCSILSPTLKDRKITSQVDPIFLGERSWSGYQRNNGSVLEN